MDGLSAALLRLVEDTDLRRSMGAAAHASRVRYLPETVGAQWCALVDELLDVRRRVPSRLQRAVDRRQHAVPRRPSIPPMARTTAAEREDTAGRVIDALEAIGATWFAVRHRSAPLRLAVDSAARTALLQALCDAHPDGELTITALASRPRDVALFTGVDPVADLLRIENGIRVVLTSDDDWVGRDTATGVEITFWTAADGFIATRRETETATRLPLGEIGSTTVEIGRRRAPSHPAFTEPGIDLVDFPIDVVYTWVDGSDPAWIERREQRRREVDDAHPAGLRDERFRSLDELRYSLRSIHAHAPWVNHIWLVTDDQVPDWLDAGQPGLTVVSHRDIFRDPAHLPTFNSHSIEANLHRIPGLSDHFLYLNDDVLLGREVSPRLFFTPAGDTIHHSRRSPSGGPPTSTSRPTSWAGSSPGRSCSSTSVGRSTDASCTPARPPARRARRDGADDPGGVRDQFRRGVPRDGERGDPEHAVPVLGAHDGEWSRGREPELRLHQHGTGVAPRPLRTRPRVAHLRRRGARGPPPGRGRSRPAAGTGGRLHESPPPGAQPVGTGRRASSDGATLGA